MTSDELYEDFQGAFEKRKFVGGLLVAMIDFLSALDIYNSGVNTYAELLQRFPRQDTTVGGKGAVTLIVQSGEKKLSLRPFYNAAERYFRAEMKRYDYPSCAPHATQAWVDYIDWIESLCSMDETTATDIRSKVIDYVLRELPSQEVVPGSVQIAPPEFRMLLENFEFIAPNGEKSGAAYQGAVFGFMRADNPHLQIEIEKVRTGSKRLQRVGDIDGWDGERLAISAEVKSFAFKEDDVPDVSGFANEVTKRGAIGLLIAQSFDGHARGQLDEMGLRALDIADLWKVVSLWDPAKQRIASESMMYYAAHVEKNSVLTDRLRVFLSDVRKGGG